MSAVATADLATITADVNGAGFATRVTPAYRGTFELVATRGDGATAVLVFGDRSLRILKAHFAPVGWKQQGGDPEYTVAGVRNILDTLAAFLRCPCANCIAG